MPNILQAIWRDSDTPARATRIETLHDKLAARLGDGARVITDESSRRVYARDLADIPRFIERALFRTTPLLIVQPRNAEEIGLVMQFANEENIPVFPRGIASSAFGGPVPTSNGIVLDLSPMQEIGAPNGNERTVTVDAGARWGDVHDFLARLNLQLYTYPSNHFATVAGWIASGGYGMNGYKYGHVSRHVAALEIVTPRGEITTIRDTDTDLAKYFATEGQMGIVARVTLRVREAPRVHAPHLLCFQSDADAFAFVEILAQKNIVPASVKFLDAHLLRLLNEHHHQNAPRPTQEEPKFWLPEKPSLLVFIDDAETGSRFSELISHLPNDRATELPNYLAGHLWADRYFSMKIRSLGPSLLAAQIVLPIHTVARFLTHARKLARRFGLEPATECHVISTSKGRRVLTMPMFLTDQSKWTYSLHLAFVSLLDRIGARYEGQPYNLGIWHAPFIKERYDAQTLRELRDCKRAQDPRNILNPRKFFRVQSRFLGITGLLFHPFVFKLALDALEFVSRFQGLRVSEFRAAPITRAHDIKLPQLQLGVPTHYDLPALARTAAECTSCGACVSVCPAYVHTQDERVTGRAKLWLARKIASGEAIAQTEADAAWLCVRCRACAEVCQTQLPLMTAYEKLEQELEQRLGKPDALIQDFVARMERNPEYRARVGLSLPIELIEQRWRKISSQSTVDSSQTQPHHLITQSPNHRITHLLITPDEDFHLPEPVHTQGGKYHIHARPAPPRLAPLGKFTIDRSDQCISCGQCVEACVYNVHSRNPLDIRRMNTPKDGWCKGCFRCIQECPRGALTISIGADYLGAGRGIFDGEVILSLQTQSVEGKIPVTGAGYRGAFAGAAFDSMWTDMSEIVRPTRDGIHGREYISTAVDLGRRALSLRGAVFATKQSPSGSETPALPCTARKGRCACGASVASQSTLALTLPPFLEIPLPILFNQLPIHRDRAVLLAMARAARQLGTFATIARADWFDALAPYAANIALAVHADEIDDFLARFALIEIADAGLAARVKRIAPEAIVSMRVSSERLAPDYVAALAREKAEVIHLAFDSFDPHDLFENLPRLHARLVEEGLRDAVTLIASGAIAMAEHTPKTIILGADAVALDVPLLVALECVLDEKCFGNGKCTRAIESIDSTWGEQRIVNLIASWRNQLLEVMGAMGMREVRRLRGERGRAMLKTELDEKLFEPVFGGR